MVIDTLIRSSSFRAKQQTLHILMFGWRVLSNQTHNAPPLQTVSPAGALTPIAVLTLGFPLCAPLRRTHFRSYKNITSHPHTLNQHCLNISFTLCPDVYRG